MRKEHKSTQHAVLAWAKMLFLDNKTGTLAAGSHRQIHTQPNTVDQWTCSRVQVKKREKKAYLAGPSPCVRNLEGRWRDEGKERESKREAQRNSAEETPAPIQPSYCKHSCFASKTGNNMAATL